MIQMVIEHGVNFSSCAEGRIYEAYQGLEGDAQDLDAIDKGTYITNFVDFINHVEPQQDADKKGNHFYYQ